MNNRIDRFDGEYEFLSNFYPAMVEIDGIQYKTTEAAFQAAKTFDVEEKTAISNAETPEQAKRMGRHKVTLRSDWELVKDSTMKEIVQLKFESHPELAKLLIETGDAELIEGNTWKDTYWGVCNGVGKNKLGKILMETRKILKEREQK